MRWVPILSLSAFALFMALSWRLAARGGWRASLRVFVLDLPLLALLRRAPATALLEHSSATISR